MNLANSTEQCIHSRNLIPLYNSGEDHQRFGFLTNHMKDCDECRDHFKTLKQKVRSLDTLIPVREANKDMQKNFESEIAAMLGQVMKHEKEVRMFNHFSYGLKNNLKDILSAFTSRTMVRAYFFLAIYFLIYKSITV